MLPLILVVSSALRSVAPLTWTPFPFGELPIENPLKGYAAYLDAAPRLSGYASMAYVTVPWSDLEPSDGTFAFDRLDALFEHPLSKGKPVVLRVWLDYPSMPCGVPGWLRAKGLKMTPYSDYGGGLSPDYENPDLKRGLVRFIGALGKRYAGSSRVRFVEIGILGFWGEWHTYPHDELFAKRSTQELVVDSMRNAFPDTKLLGRNPANPALKLPWMGFHDDMLPDDTDAGQDWNFLPGLIANGLADNWKVAPIGAEMVPFNAKRLLGQDWDKLVRAVRKGHFSFIAGYCPVLEQNVSDVFRARSDELARLLGYSYRLERAKWAPAAVRVQAWGFEIDGSNVGVAPFYYPWPVRLALLRPDGTVAEQASLDDDIRTWLPGKFDLRGTVSWKSPPGQYALAFGVLDPATSQPAIRFANRLPMARGWTILNPSFRLTN